LAYHCQDGGAHHGRLQTESSSSPQKGLLLKKKKLNLAINVFLNNFIGSTAAADAGGLPADGAAGVDWRH